MAHPYYIVELLHCVFTLQGNNDYSAMRPTVWRGVQTTLRNEFLLPEVQLSDLSVDFTSFVLMGIILMPIIQKEKKIVFY